MRLPWCNSGTTGGRSAVCLLLKPYPINYLQKIFCISEQQENIFALIVAFFSV
jgi:hypothetical protein